MKKHGFIKFILMCAVVFAAVVAILAVINRMKDKLCLENEEDEDDDDSEDTGCNGVCEGCSGCSDVTTEDKEDEQ